MKPTMYVILFSICTSTTNQRLFATTFSMQFIGHELVCCHLFCNQDVDSKNKIEKLENLSTVYSD